MKIEEKGWIIINETRNEMYQHTFKRTRSECIKVFVKGSSEGWSYWKRKYGFS